MTTTPPAPEQHTPFDPPQQSAHKPLPGAYGQGALGKATGGIYWYLVLTILVALAALPTFVLLLFLEPVAGNIPLMAVAAVFVGPAVSAGLYAVRARYTDDELKPARAFLKGYRLNWRGVLLLWVPALVVVGIIGFTLAGGEVIGLMTAYRAVLTVIGVLAITWLLIALAITTFFTFRVRDVARLSSYYLIMMPRVSLAMLALVVVVGAAAWFAWLLLPVIGGIWVWFLYQNTKPMLVDVYRRFTVDAVTQIEGDPA